MFGKAVIQYFNFLIKVNVRYMQYRFLIKLFLMMTNCKCGDKQATLLRT